MPNEMTIPETIAQAKELAALWKRTGFPSEGLCDLAADLARECERLQREKDEAESHARRSLDQLSDSNAALFSTQTELRLATSRAETAEDHLSKAEAEVERLRKLVEWQPISEAPEYVDGMELHRVLVYSTDFGITIGKVYKLPDGHIVRRVEGQWGDWNITYFAELPTAPASSPACTFPSEERGMNL